jgi:hypothetical protein
MRESIHAARQQHINAFMMTDHFDNHDFRMIYDELLRQYSCVNDDYFDVDGVWLFPGMEVETAEGCHILLNGNLSNVLNAYEIIAPYTTEETYLPLADIFKLLEDIDLFKTYAHPFRPKREISRIDSTLIHSFDALDINGKDLWRFGIDHRHQVTQFAAVYGVPAVGGSDAHHPLQVGVVFNTLHEQCSNISAIRQVLRQGRYEVHINPQLSRMVADAQIAKKAFKQQYRSHPDDMNDTNE